MGCGGGWVGVGAGRGRGREEGERGRERIPSRLHANEGLHLTNDEIVTGAEIKSGMLTQLSQTGTPTFVSLLHTINQIY